jgi:hypothetical protein
MENPKNCWECAKNRSCKSYYRGSMCTEVKDSDYNKFKEARERAAREVKRE